jgi:hypothetical protein
MLSIRNMLMCTGLGAVVAICVLFAGMATRSVSESALPAADAAPTTTSAAPKSTTGTTTTPKVAGTDHRGFVDSEARCAEGRSAVAYGRTQRSLVAICPDGEGGLEYRGVRISDGATLITEADATGDGTFVAVTEGAEYTVSPSTLSVTSGGKVIYRDTWIAYEAPRFAAETGSTAATSTTPTTTKSAAPAR